MEIIVGKNAGFCFGVERAVEGTLNEVKNSNKKIYCLGELVHNGEVINKIEKSGIVVVSNIDEIKEDNIKLIIRAHGVDRKIYEKARQSGMEIIDFTCPFVSKIHDIVWEYKEKGYYIFLIGNSVHPEIIGTKSYCGDNYTIINDINGIEEGIDKLLKSGIKDLLVISQTTFSTNKFDIIENIIKERLNNKLNIVIKKTICNATEVRQKETEELSKEVDLMIVIGGKNSSNTRKLYDIARQYTNSLLIEAADEIDVKRISNYNKIGIMAGASTPQFSIDLLIKQIKSTN